MSKLLSSMLVLGALGSAMTFGCATKPIDEETSSDDLEVDVDLDGVSEKTEGSSYDGWTLYPSGNKYQWDHNDYVVGQVTASFTRSHGHATRGGGTCVVLKSDWTCSDDWDCQGYSTYSYGSSAWGYCYSGTCYTRPGSDADFCYKHPNNTPGTKYGPTGAHYSIANTHYNANEVYAMGCMTKTSGPSYNCGSTNTGLWMRTVTKL